MIHSSTHPCHRGLGLAALLALWAGCFDPQPAEGRPCADGECPPGLTCQEGLCRSAAPADASSMPSDAPLPADAASGEDASGVACGMLRPLIAPPAANLRVLNGPITVGSPITFEFDKLTGTNFIGIELTEADGTSGRLAEKLCSPLESYQRAAHCGAESPGLYCAFVTSRQDSSGDLRFHGVLAVEIVSGPPQSCPVTGGESCGSLGSWPEAPCACLD
jgi:hypothetical protein